MKAQFRWVLDWFAKVLAKADVVVLRKSTLDLLEEDNRLATAMETPLPAGAAEVLRGDNPRLQELQSRYRDHPAAPVMWSQEFLEDQLDLSAFRGDNAYVWQVRKNTEAAQYALTAYYLERNDELGLLDTLTEDGLFGAFTFDFDGRIVSRDLLDSVVELNYLHQRIDLHRKKVRVLDIGAGYGRLASRATEAFPTVEFVCTDAVAQSTFLSEYYLDYRGTERAKVVPLDEIESAIAATPFDLAVNIHSFSEAPAAAISWWIDLLAASPVQRLLVVPNSGQDLLSTEAGEERIDFKPIIEDRGFKLAAVTPKYEHSDAVQEYGIFPSWYFLFVRT